MGRPRKDGREPIIFALDLKGDRTARVRRILGDRVPPEAPIESLLALFSEPRPSAGEAVAWRIEHFSHADEAFGRLPKGAVSKLLGATERLQSAIALAAFLEPRKVRALYLAALAKRLKPLLRAAPSLPESLNGLPVEAAALKTYLLLHRGGIAKSLGHIDFKRHGVAALREEVARSSTARMMKFADEELAEMAANGRISSKVAASVAVRTHGLRIAPATFLRKYVEAKHPGWPSKTRRIRRA